MQVVNVIDFLQGSIDLHVIYELRCPYQGSAAALVAQLVSARYLYDSTGAMPGLRVRASPGAAPLDPSASVGIFQRVLSFSSLATPVAKLAGALRYDGT